MEVWLKIDRLGKPKLQYLENLLAKKNFLCQFSYDSLCEVVEHYHTHICITIDEYLAYDCYANPSGIKKFYSYQETIVIISSILANPIGGHYGVITGKGNNRKIRFGCKTIPINIAKEFINILFKINDKSNLKIENIILNDGNNFDITDLEYLVADMRKIGQK